MDDASAAVASAHHRKIELQAPEDLTYLIDKVRRAAQARLDEAFPPAAHSDDDELRRQIEKLVDDYISRTFTLAAPNLSINGLSVDASSFFSASADDNKNSSNKKKKTAAEPAYEPFDGRKRQRVEDLSREEEDLLREIAALKRSVPAATARRFAEDMHAGVAADEEAVAASRVAIAQLAEGKTGTGEGEVMLAPLQRQDEVEGAFRGAVDGLARLKKEMPATVARMERARVAGEYILTQPR